MLHKTKLWSLSKAWKMSNFTHFTANHLSPMVGTGLLRWRRRQGRENNIWGINYHVFGKVLSELIADDDLLTMFFVWRDLGTRLFSLSISCKQNRTSLLQATKNIISNLNIISSRKQVRGRRTSQEGKTK